MGVLDELGRRASRVSQNVADGAKKLTETAKLNDQIRDGKRHLEVLFQNFGKVCYDEVCEHDYSESQHKAIIDEIKATIEAVENLQLEEQTLRGVRLCVQCNQEVSVGAGFCPHCGAALPAPKLPAKPAKRFCAGCGGELAADAKFCLSCGTKAE